MATWKKILVSGLDLSGSDVTNNTINVTDGSNNTDITLGGAITFAADGDLSVAESGGTVTYSFTAGAVTNSFATINAPNGTDPVADSSSDTLNLTEGNGITITGNSSTDTIDIAVPDGGIDTLQLAAGAVETAKIADGNVTFAKIAGAAVITATETISANDNDSAFPTAAAVIDYVSAQVTAQDLDVQGDTGGALSIDLDSDTLSIVGTTNEIETAGSGSQIQIGLPADVVISTIDLTGAAGVRLQNDETITNATDGTVLINGEIASGTGSAAGVFKSNGNQDVTLKTGNTTTGSITITNGANGDITIDPNGTGAVVVNGDLTVTGTTTTVESTNLLVDDTFISLNDNATADADTGIVFGGSNNKVLAWDNTAGRFSMDLTGGDASAVGGGLSSDGFFCVAHSGAGTPAGVDDLAIAGLEKIGNIYVDTSDNDAIYIYS